MFKCLWLHFSFSVPLLPNSQGRWSNSWQRLAHYRVACAFLKSRHCGCSCGGAQQSSREFQFSFGKPLLGVPPKWGNRAPWSHTVLLAARAEGKQRGAADQAGSKSDLFSWISDGDTSYEPFTCTIPASYEKTQISLTNEGKEEKN